MVGYIRANSFVFDQTTSSQFKNNHTLNMYFLKSMENFANDRLKVRGHLFLNEVLDDLGISRTQAGALCGWIQKKGAKVSFNLDAPMNQDKNVKSQPIHLIFNIDPGEIFDKI